MSLTGTARAERTATGLIMGRRPVVDSGLGVVGYRLALSAGLLTPDLADRDGDLAAVAGGRPVFVEPCPSLLAGAGEGDWPPALEGAVIEVGPSVVDDPSALDGLRRLAGRGAGVAVRRRLGAECPQELLDMAGFVLIDRGTPPDGLAFRLDYEAELAATVVLSGAGRARVVALGVDSFVSLSDAASAGFHLFEGRVLSRPMPVATPSMTPSRAACFQMLQKVGDPETSAAEIERIVETDPGLSYRILHVSGAGADNGLRREVRSIREAAVLLGRDWLQKWLLMMVVADASQGAPEQLTIALTRARMCELLAAAGPPYDEAAAFTVGLVSAMDLLLGWPLSEVVSKLAITSDLRAALLRRDGRLGDILADVMSWMDWEPGGPVSGLRCGVAAPAAESAYLEALGFARSVTDFLRGEGDAPAFG